MKGKKLVIAVILALIVCLVLIPTCAFADDETTPVAPNEGTPAETPTQTVEVTVEQTTTVGEGTTVVETKVEYKDGTTDSKGTMQDAIADGNISDEKDTGLSITLDSDVTENDIVVNEGKTVTINLNGNTLTSNRITVNNGHLAINDDTGEGQVILQKSIVVNGDKAKFTLNGGNVVVSNDYGVYCKDGGSAVVNGGSITSQYAPLTGNNTTGDMNFEVNGGTLTANYGPAIYMPGQVNLKITGGELNGGVSLRMGQVTITGGTINSVKEDIDSPAKYYDYSGNVWFPDALYVIGGSYNSENTTYGNSLNLNITGGTFNCTNGVGSAVAIYDLGKVEQEMNINISGNAKLVTNATDRSAYQVLSLSDIGVTEPATGFGEYSGEVSTTVTGGTFSDKDIEQYVANGYVVTENGGEYTVSKHVEPAPVVVPEQTTTTKKTDTIVEAKKDNATEQTNVAVEGTTAKITVTDDKGEFVAPQEVTIKSVTALESTGATEASIQLDTKLVLDLDVATIKSASTSDVVTVTNEDSVITVKSGETALVSVDVKAVLSETEQTVTVKFSENTVKVVCGDTAYDIDLSELGGVGTLTLKLENGVLKVYDKDGNLLKEIEKA